MPAPLARGLIITVSILVAAGIAAYEHPQIREWLERSREKIAMAIQSLGEDINPQPRRHSRAESSMFEDRTEMAERRRAQARADILERRRVIQERQHKRQGSESDKAKSFDELVDEQGNLKSIISEDIAHPQSSTSGLEAVDRQGTIRQRIEVTDDSLHESVDASIPVRPHSDEPAFESRYEQEMRSAWNMPIVGKPMDVPKSHASESLIDLTPSTEEIPDPDVLIPGTPHQRPVDRSEYFSATASYASVREPTQDADLISRSHDRDVSIPPTNNNATTSVTSPPSATISLAGSIIHISPREAYDSEDDVMSEFGDGIRTPASAWTEVDSTTSGDA